VESNALVLGCVSGQNGCPAAVDVGIGTTTPGAPLEIDGSNQSDLWVKAPESGVGAGIDLFTTGTGGLQWEILDTGATSSQGPNKLNFRNATDVIDVLTLELGGSVGIGTTSPDNLLSVNGSADKPGGGSWGTFSDQRLKNLEGSFSSGLSEVMKINPVKYRYKDDNGMGIRDRDEHVGVVAQEIQKAIPEAVTENSKGYLLVNNDPIIWAMLNAIKKQQGMIEQQKETIRAQAAAMNTQQAQIEAQQKESKLQQAEIKQLTRQVREVQAALKANGKSKSTVESVKGTAPMLRQ